MFDDIIQEVVEDINDKVLLRELIFGVVYMKGMIKIDLVIIRLMEYFFLGLLYFIKFIDIFFL